MQKSKTWATCASYPLSFRLLWHNLRALLRADKPMLFLLPCLGSSSIACKQNSQVACWSFGFLGLSPNLLLYREQVEEKARASQKFCAQLWSTPKKYNCLMQLNYMNNESFRTFKMPISLSGHRRFQFATQMLDLVRNVDHSKALCTAMVINYTQRIFYCLTAALHRKRILSTSGECKMSM